MEACEKCSGGKETNTEKSECGAYHIISPSINAFDVAHYSSRKRIDVNEF